MVRRPRECENSCERTIIIGLGTRGASRVLIGDANSKSLKTDLDTQIDGLGQGLGSRSGGLELGLKLVKK
jgi:hypothetical protein